MCVLYYKFILYIPRGLPSKAVKKKRKNKIIRESSFNIENGNVDVGGGGGRNLCVCSESLKNR